jgi:hypothetical protein
MDDVNRRFDLSAEAAKVYNDIPVPTRRMDNCGRFTIMTAKEPVTTSGTIAPKIQIIHYANICFRAVQFYENRVTFVNVDA